MRLNENEVNNYLQTHLGQYEDSFQQAWLEIVERDPQTFDEIPPITRRIRNRALKQYLNKKFREQSLYDPIGRNGDERFTLESILQSPTNESNQEQGNGSNRFYKKIEEALKFKRDRFESWKKLMEDKGKQKEDQFKLKVQLRREELEFKKEQFALMAHREKGLNPCLSAAKKDLHSTNFHHL